MPGPFDLGEGLLGDAPAEPSPRVPKTPPAALRFDPQTRRHVIGDDGAYAASHPVDAKVVNQLLMMRGRIRSAGDTGARYREVPSAYHPRAKSMVEDMTRQALAESTRSGDITIVAITMEPRPTGGMLVGVDYHNNRLDPLRRRPSARAELVV